MVALVALAMVAAALWGFFDVWLLSKSAESNALLPGPDSSQDASVALLLSGVVTAGIAGLVRLKVGGSPRDEQGERELDLRNREVLALVGLAGSWPAFLPLHHL